MTRRRIAAGLLAAAALVTSACGGASGGSTPGAAGAHRLTVGLTYTPNIQFAPFYVAAAKGYYRDAGLAVTLRHHGAAESEFGALRAGQEDVIEAGGDEMLQARSTSVPVVDIGTLYQTYPVVLLVPKGSPIRTAADLRGRTVGIPGPFGETYYGLRALLRGAALSTKDTSVKYIGFTQQAALAAGHVDAVMGYVNNEAVQFARSGNPVTAIPIGSRQQPAPLVGVGLGALRSTLRSEPTVIKRFVAATLRGQQYAIDHPQDAVSISQKYVPGLAGSDQTATALAILRATAPLLSTAGTRPGHNDPATWRAMATFMRTAGLITAPVDATGAYTNGYLPAAGAK